MEQIKYLDISDNEMKRFISLYGLDIYDTCLCGSEKKFKFCCWKNHERKTSSEVISWASQIYSNSLTKKDQNNRSCLFSNCRSRAIKSHMFSKGTHVKRIAGKNKYLYRLVKTFRNGCSITLKQENMLKDATTFRGFCPSHDNLLFDLIDNYYELDMKALYALAYRSIAYQITKFETERSVMVKKHFKHVPKYYSNQIVSNKSLDFQTYIIKTIRELEIQIDGLKTLLKRVEDNFDSSSQRWGIKHDVLRFTKIINVKVSNPDILFSNVHMSINSDINTNNLLAFNKSSNCELDHIITLVMPNDSMDAVSVVFATQVNASDISQAFLSFVESTTDHYVCSVINNLIISNMDAFYFSESYANEIEEKNLMGKIEEAVQQPILFNFNKFEIENMKREPRVAFLEERNTF